MFLQRIYSNLVSIDVNGIICIEDVDSMKNNFEIEFLEEIKGVDETNIRSIGRYMKEVSIRSWFEESKLRPKVLYIMAIRQCIIRNDSGYDGSGTEYFTPGEKFIGVDIGDVILIQKRKGTVLYINKFDNSDNFTIDYFNPDDETYDNLKEIQYIINNNYRKDLAKI